MKKIIKRIFILLLLVVTAFSAFQVYKMIKDLDKKMVNIEKIPKKEIKNIDTSEYIFKNYHKQAKKLLKEMTIKEKVGQLFLVRYNKNDVEYLSNYYPGGYILFAKDFENHTKDSMKDELVLAQKKNKYPLIIGVDEEGGTVTRVSKYKNFREERFKSPRDYYDEGGYELLEKIEQEKATLLKEIGINLNLAPVADVSTNPDDFIYERSFKKSAEETAEYVKNMVKYAKNNHINACLKHFPGYGSNIDTHSQIAIDERSYESLKENDFLPFKAGIEEKVPAILISHNIIKSIDDKHPASLSDKVIKELRNTLNFDGIIITDDLAMDAVKDYVDNKEAATLAIQAGNTMIITSNFLEMYEEVINAVKENKITEEQIDKAVLSIIEWKYYSNLFLQGG